MRRAGDNHAQILRRQMMQRIAHLLVHPCLFCGAASGEPCRTKNGIIIFAIGQMHDQRLTGCAFPRYRRFKPEQREGKADGDVVQET